MNLPFSDVWGGYTYFYIFILVYVLLCFVYFCTNNKTYIYLLLGFGLSGIYTCTQSGARCAPTPRKAHFFASFPIFCRKVVKSVPCGVFFFFTFKHGFKSNP